MVEEKLTSEQALRCREVPHELTVDHQQRRRFDNTCTKLLENPTDSHFWVFYRNSTNRENVWTKPVTQPTTLQVVAKQGRFAQKIILCVSGGISKG